MFLADFLYMFKGYISAPRKKEHIANSEQMVYMLHLR
jgi:hypothetical protein